jgi:hypothetical protein
MKATLESTTKIVTINGVPARIWEGVTEKGVRCHAYITRIAVQKDDDASEFEKDLHKCREPSPEIVALDPRIVL